MSPVFDSAKDIAATYMHFARAFDDPNAAIWQTLEASGDIVRTRSPEEREAEYLAAFELGRETPSVPPYEGFCRPGESREGILEDLFRFYSYFDLRLRENNRDYPDHLVTELEFVAYLASREAHALETGTSPLPYRRAQGDFLERHLGLWVLELAKRLARTGTVYGKLSQELADFVDTHRAYLKNGSE